MKLKHWEWFLTFSSRVFAFLLVSVTVIVLSGVFTHPLGAYSTFKFPWKIRYKVIEKNEFKGFLDLVYEEAAQEKDNRKLSSLKIIDTSKGINKEEQWCSLIFRDDFSLYKDYQIKDKEVILESKIQRETGPGGQTKTFLICNKRGSKDSIKKEITNNHKVISFFSSFIAASRYVAFNTYRTVERFNFCIQENTGIVELRYKGKEKVMFQGKSVSVDVISLDFFNENQHQEILELKIFKSSGNCYFPVAVNFFNVVELKAESYQAFPSTPPPALARRQQLLVAGLPFMDARTGSIHTQTKVMKAFWEKLEREIRKMGNVKGMDVVIDRNGYYIAGTNRNIMAIVDTVFDQDLTPDNRMEKIVRKYMGPNGPDVILTGQYVDKTGIPTISIRPIIIFKSPRKIITRNLMFSRNELICRDMNNNEVLCGGAHQYIEEKLQEFLSPSQKPIPPKRATLSNQVNVTYFNFMDFVNQTSLESTDMGELIEEAIQAGIHKAKQSTSGLSIDRNLHSYVNTSGNVGKLADILFDPGLEQDKKIQRIIDSLMIPNRVDVIVTGLYIRTIGNSTITLRPMVIVKSTRKILTRNLGFTLNELLCRPPHQNKKVLCKKAYEEIVRTIKELLEQI